MAYDRPMKKKRIDEINTHTDIRNTKWINDVWMNVHKVSKKIRNGRILKRNKREFVSYVYPHNRYKNQYQKHINKNNNNKNNNRNNNKKIRLYDYNNDEDDYDVHANNSESTPYKVSNNNNNNKKK